MLRKIIKIDQTKCNGCGACASACHEGAIEMVNGKAQLTREDYCDGFGDCLPACPVDAITFEMREAPAYNEEAVLASKAKKSFVCPGSRVKAINKKEVSCEPNIKCVSELTSWPVQIKLVPVNAPYFNGAKLLVAADCTAFAYASIHQDFIKEPSVVTIVTLHGITFPLSFKALFTAFSKPPQHGTSMRSTEIFTILLFFII